MNELSEYILKKADHRDDAALALAYGLYKQAVNGDYSLRRLITDSEMLTDTVSEEGSKDEIYTVTDDKEFKSLREDDAPVIPLTGKIIIGSCIICLLFVSVFTFTAGLYGTDSLKTLMAMTEMRILLALCGAMSIMLPILVILNWYNRYRRFKKLMDEEDNRQDDVYMMLSARDNNVQFGWEL